MASTFLIQRGAYRCDIAFGPDLSFIAMAYAALQFTRSAIPAPSGIFEAQMPGGRGVDTVASYVRTGYTFSDQGVSDAVGVRI